MQKSKFAIALSALFDETGLYSRDEWAQYLFTKASTIELWCTDQAVPRPDHLGMILVTLKLTADVPQGPIVAFETVTKMPSTETTPFAEFMGPTVLEYMDPPLLSKLTETLRGASPEDRLRILSGTYYPQGRS